MTKETQENIERASWDETIEEYNEPLGWMFYTAITIISIGITLTVLDLIFGAERVTEVIAGLF